MTDRSEHERAEHEPSGDALGTWLRAGFAAVRAEAPHGEPVDPETIWAAAHGELPAAQIEALVDRMAHDPDLAEEWRLALGRDAEPSSKVIVPSVARWRRVAYVAAPLVAAAVAVLWLASRDGVRIDAPPEDLPGTYRGEDGEQAPAWSVQRAERGLSWEPVAGAVRYRVRVMTRDFEVLLDTRSETPRIELPDDPRARGPLRWQIDALRPDGTVERRGTGELAALPGAR